MNAIDIRNMDFNLLVPLRALLEERNLTRAAKRVHLTQSAMSHALERMRATLGDELLIRSRGSYALSPRAKTILAELNLLLPRLEQLWREAAFEPSIHRGRIRLMMTDYAAALFLPAILPRIEREAPLIQIHVVPWHSCCYELLTAGELDFVVSPVAAPPHLRVEKLMEEEFVCLVCETHGMRGKRFSLEQYLKQRHVAVETELGIQTLIDRGLAELGHRRTIAVRMSYFLSAMPALRHTKLVLTSPAALGKRYGASHGLRCVSAPKELSSFQYSMIWHPRIDMESFHIWFRNMLTSRAGVTGMRAGVQTYK